MTKQRIHRLRSTLETGIRVLAFISLVRKIGLRRMGRAGLVATEMYLTHSSRRRRRA
jgi:hypothetical protein